jgi:RsiW-degrading membrane proteinase PrsW (M82 family)
MMNTIPISKVEYTGAGDVTNDSANVQFRLEPLEELGSRSGENLLLEETSPPPHDSGPPAPAPSPSRRDVAAPSSTSAREFLYLVLALALIPLGFSLLAKEDLSVRERLEQAMKRAGPEVVDRVKELASDQHASFDDLLAALPGNRLDDRAHLPRQTKLHWFYAALAAGVFWALLTCLFPAEKKSPIHLLLVGLATATMGIVLLFGFQYVAAVSQRIWLRDWGVIALLFYIAKFIGWSYASASDPNSNFLISFVGFTCGVGLCEELCKAIPLLCYFEGDDAKMGWRGACVWGLASGAGFGISEGIMYSADHYNGVSPAGIYVVRFVSCVALHALWCGSVGITLWRRQETIQEHVDWANYSFAILRILSVPMVLHGLYDTLLKKDMNAYALLVGLASFAWFVWQVESARREPAVESSPGWAHA